MTKTALWWIFAIIFTFMVGEYQKRTGPTYEVRGKAVINDHPFRYKLIRTAENDKDAEISLKIPDTTVQGTIRYKRFKSNDEWSNASLTRDGSKLVFMMPRQPSAGKMMYEIKLTSGEEQVKLAGKDGDPVVMRFKGHVPRGILVPHIIFMFLGLLFSTRTAIEALIHGRETFHYSLVTLLFLVIGGLIFGPIVQKYAFGAFWTGWPVGHDLTDNKTVLMVLLWVFAAFKLKKDSASRLWPVIAAAGVLVVYLIPHSILGSEINYTKIPR